jgi:hypothetical protein
MGFGRDPEGPPFALAGFGVSKWAGSFEQRGFAPRQVDYFLICAPS